MDPSPSIRKPLRARKTMTPSSRKQVELLGRLKRAQEPGRTANGGSPGRFAVGETNGLPRSSPEELGAPLPPPPTIKSFIQERLDVAAGDLDQKLQHLNQRIDRTQCLRKHEGITIRIVKRISRLVRRVNAVAAVQAAERPRKVGDSPNKVPTGGRSLPGIASQQPAPSPKPAPAGSKASPPAAESSKDVVCLDAETQRPSVPTAPAPDVRQDGASVVACATAQTLDSRKSKLVIDLTEEGSSNAPPEEETASGRAKLAPESQKSDPPQPALLSPKEVPGRFPHLPPLPRIRLLPELVNDFQGTLPPQKLELVVVRLLNPKGIGLRWNVSKVDARCAPLESFHLFLFVDSASAGAPFSWSRTNVIQALPLPMVISLSQLPASGVYYFTMQSKDIYGRYGPFCDVRSISVP